MMLSYYGLHIRSAENRRLLFFHGDDLNGMLMHS